MERGSSMTAEPGPTLSFEAQCGALVKDVFRELVRQAVQEGKDPDEQARAYAALGKPDFVAAYLLAGSLADADRRELLALAYDTRASYTEERAHDFDRRFHRPFPLLHTDASRDRATARLIRAGGVIQPETVRRPPEG
jgi:hypothetical protein